MSEIWFYQLTTQKLDRALPALIERALGRGWRVVVQARSDERLAALDDALWTYADDSFIAHGTARDGDPQMQQVYLTTGCENANAAAARFLVDGAEAAAVADEPYERVALLFDGSDPDDLGQARVQWKALKAQGRTLAYWRQDEEGRWRKEA